MSGSSFLGATEVSGQLIFRGRVIEISPDGYVVVEGGDRNGKPAKCDVLDSSRQRARTLAPGDLVLVLHTMGSEERGVVLGRLGSQTQQPESLSHAGIHQDQVQDELVIEAKHSLTLRVGEGSITIREDGKILIKGKDLVSHAKRLNRIRGGSVQIN